MKATMLGLLALALPFSAHAAKTSFACAQVKPAFGPADKTMSLTRLTHGAMPEGAPVRYQLQVALNGEVRLAEPAVAKESKAEVAFKVPGKQVAGHIPLAAAGESVLKIGRQVYRFKCQAL
jgi:hypothetical protein